MLADDGRGERNRGAGCPLLRGLPRMAVIGKGGTRGCLPASPSVRLGTLHHVFSDRCAGHAEQYPVTHRERDAYDTGIADLRHERVPGAEGQAGYRGDEA